MRTLTTSSSLAARLRRAVARLEQGLTLWEKLLLPVLVVVGLALGGGMLATLKLLESRSFASYREQALLVASAVQADIEAEGGLDDPGHLQSHLSSLVRSVLSLRKINLYVVQDGQPIVLAASDPPLIGQTVDSHDIAPIYSGGTAAEKTRLGEEPVLELVHPIFIDGRPVASVGVYQSLVPYYAEVRSQQRLSLIIGGIAVASIAGAILMVSRQLILARLRRLVAAQDRLAAGDLAARVEGSWSPAARDEMVRAIHHFNTTADTLQTAYRTMERLATTDGLTGLCNHRYLWDALENEVARARRLGYPLGLLFLDVDGFKRANDSFGHAAGDEALRHLAQLLRRSLRDTDLAARYGGDEFVVLLPGCDLAAARLVGNKLCRAVNASFSDSDGDERLLGITVSVGVASLPQCADSAEDLIRQADLALYEAKAAGHNRVITASEAAHPH